MKKKILLIILILVLLFVAYFFLGSPPQAKEIQWGVNFSQKHAELLGLDWKETYLALINDLEAKNIKLATYWDLIEKEEGEYDFEDLDWQIDIAEEKEVNLLLVIGMKTPRWPECHIPEWAKNLGKENQQEKILNLLEVIILRYRDSAAISMWQVENEPFFPFGECPWVDKEFVKKEISQVRSLDIKQRPIVISDSGEGSSWFTVAKLGDIVGTTMYRKVWFSFSWGKEKLPFLPEEIGFYVDYPFTPTLYWRKTQIIKKLFNKDVIVVELQAEPWGPKLLYDIPLEDQEKLMNLERFKGIMEFAKKTGLKEFYLWGGEWWYWMKEKQNKPEIWQEASKLFK